MTSYTSAQFLGLGPLIDDTVRLLRTHFRTLVLVTAAAPQRLSLDERR